MSKKSVTIPHPTKEGQTIQYTEVWKGPNLKFTDDQRIMVITYRSIGLSYRKIAERMKDNGVTISPQYCQELCTNPTVINSLQHSDVADKFKGLMRSKFLLDSSFLIEKALEEDKVDKSSTLQLITAGSILFDKARLLSGESTDNIAIRYSKVTEASQEVDRISKEIQTIEQEIQCMSD